MAAGIRRRYLGSGGTAVKSVGEIFERAQAGDVLAARVVDETALLTAMAAATVIATVDPQLLIMGGSIAAHPEFADKVARVLPQLVPRTVEIRISTLGKRASVIGALSVALRALHDQFFGIAELAGTVALPPQRAQ